jgi:hypothetical protein
MRFAVPCDCTQSLLHHAGEDIMKTKPLLLLVLGLLLLGAGAAMQFTGGPPPADTPLAQHCREKLIAQGAGPSMVAQCDQAAFATAMTATDAAAAARSIGAANRSDVGGNAVAMVLIGLGLVLAIGGIIFQRTRG